MPWQNVRVTKNTEQDDVFGISLEFADAAEFATDVFTYSEARIRNDLGGRNEFKTRANAAVDRERAKRQNVSTKNAAILAFMNR